MEAIRFRLRFYLVALVIVTALGTFGFILLEGLPLLDAFYFAIVTIATVGYGDVHATTSAGKVLAMLLIVLGVGTFLGAVANGTEMMLNRRENQVRLKKINMLIGVFFSEMGTRLLASFSDADPELPQIRKELVVTGKWTDQDFLRVSKLLKSQRYEVDLRRCSLEALKDFGDERGCTVRNTGITFETRPDYANAGEIDQILEMGATKVELGVQQVSNTILERMQRGHSVDGSGC